MPLSTKTFASKPKTNEIILVFLWKLFEAIFSQSHVVFGISGEVAMLTMLINIQYQKVNMPWWGNMCNILQNTSGGIGYTFAYSVLLVTDTRCGLMPHSVYVNSYSIYCFWKLFHCGKKHSWNIHWIPFGTFFPNSNRGSNRSLL